MTRGLDGVAPLQPAPPPLGLSIASHSGLAPARFGELSAAAEAAGFGAVFVAEGHGDALSLCHPIAAATNSVRVGTAIANAALRPPVLAAKTAAQLDQASDGRFILGLGTANAVMNSRFGIAPFHALKMIEEYVPVVRAVLRGQADGYAGQVFRTGMVPLDSPPVRAELPIYLAALGPRMQALAGQDPASVEIACVVHVCRSDEAELAAAAARAVVPRYVLHPAAGALFGDGIDGTDLGPARSRTLAGDRAGAAEVVPQSAADGFVAHGDAAACTARVEQYRAAGVDLPVVFPMPVAGDWQYERVIEEFGRI